MKQSRAAFLLAFLPVFLAWQVLRLVPEPLSRMDNTLHLAVINATEAAELAAVFRALDYAWPPAAPVDAGTVPPVAVSAVPGDLDTLSVDERKSIFFRILAPLVAMENRKLREQRRFLETTFSEFDALPATSAVSERVREIARHFGITGDLDSPAIRERLLRRVDVVPAALVIAQAANESGWGTSRFAREANNLFGMWTWDPESGLAPRQRDEDARHFIRVFDNLRAAVENYLHTINVGSAYRELRALRAAQRLRGEQPDALLLAAGLVNYSARREDYVREIRSIIEYNALDELPPLRLESQPDGG